MYLSYDLTSQEVITILRAKIASLELEELGEKEER